MTLEAFLDHLEKPRRSGRGYLATCPAHPDKSPSLSITIGDDEKILVHCFSGCTAEEIVDEIGLTFSDLFANARPDPDMMRQARKRKTLQETIDSVGISRSAICLHAEKIINAATGVDISLWSTNQVNTATNIVAEARSVLIQEERNEF